MCTLMFNETKLTKQSTCLISLILFFARTKSFKDVANGYKFSISVILFAPNSSCLNFGKFSKFSIYLYFKKKVDINLHHRMIIFRIRLNADTFLSLLLLKNSLSKFTNPSIPSIILILLYAKSNNLLLFLK